MQDLPHRYSVVASAETGGDVHLESHGLSPLQSSAPVEFGGAGDRWSPETLLTAAVADCFALTFRAVAAASKVVWTGLRVEVDGRLDRVDRTLQFTRFDLRARVRVPAGANVEQARRALEKAERGCLISNSLKAPIELQIDVDLAELPKNEQSAGDYAKIA